MSSTSAQLSAHQAWREHHLAGVILAGSVLSIIGSLYMILGFVFLKTLRTFRHQLILGLAISDLFLALSFFIPSASMLLDNETSSPDNRTFCMVNGFFIQFFFLQIDLWQITIAATTVVFLLWPCVTLDWARERIYMLWILPWAASLAFGMVAYGIWSYKDIGAYCWIEQPMVRLFFNYIPRWVIILACLITYGWIFWLIRKVRRNAERERRYRIANTPRPMTTATTATTTTEAKEPISPQSSTAETPPLPDGIDYKDDVLTILTPVYEPPLYIAGSNSSLASSNPETGPIYYPRVMAEHFERARLASRTTVQSSTFGVPATSTTALATTATTTAAATATITPAFDEEEQQRRQVRKIAIQLISFPLATALLWTVPTGVMIYQVINGPDSVNVHVEGFAQMLLVFNGFVDAHVYGFNERTAMGWKDRLQGRGRYSNDVQEMPGRVDPAIAMTDMSRDDTDEQARRVHSMV
ncbi:hypothetical protein TWF696_005117 [Orbilia brochopaga]|uniref:G-protein coupled receptors family 2 profile 2 domain-containing protein n=1 Tax=Orbilia brochopaga TaxID=3140254 RepID=A0AAV9V311_9PEZI